MSNSPDQIKRRTCLKARTALAVLVAAFAAISAPAAQADVFGSLSPMDGSSSAVPSGNYLVTFAAGTSEADQSAVLAGAAAVDVSYVPPLRLHTVLLPTGSAAVDQLRAEPSVTRVEAEDTRAASAVPGDPGYASQWSLPKIGWDQVYGSLAPAGTATVALLDTGVDAGHGDLAGNVVPGASMLELRSEE